MLAVQAESQSFDVRTIAQRAHSVLSGDRNDRRFIPGSDALIILRFYEIHHKSKAIQMAKSSSARPEQIKLLEVHRSSDPVNFPRGWMSSSIKVSVQPQKNEKAKFARIKINDSQVKVEATDALVESLPIKDRRSALSVYSSKNEEKGESFALKENIFLVIVMSKLKATEEELQNVMKDIRQYYARHTHSPLRINDKYTYVVLYTRFFGTKDGKLKPMKEPNQVKKRR